MRDRRRSLTTTMLHADAVEGDDLGVSPALHQTVAYRYRDAAHQQSAAVPLGYYTYTRRGNQTSGQIARVIAELEGGETGMMFASGVGAIATTMMALLQAGDHVVGQRNQYIGTTEMMDKVLPRYGVEATRVDQTSVEAFERALRPNTKLIMLETPSNPMLYVTDLRRVCDLARSRGILTACDNTFATPVNQRPLDLGVDIVLHSVSKYIGGHHDLLAGNVTTSRVLAERIWDMAYTTGAIAAPFNSWLALRGIRTLELRMGQHNRNGLAVAQFLEAHPAVRQVYYPGLTSHPQHELAAAQMTGFGGLLTFDLKGGYDAGQRFLARTKLADYAGGLGGVSSTALQPAVLFGGRLSDEQLADQGITAGLIRFAAGIENTEDMLADVEQALA